MAKLKLGVSCLNVQSWAACLLSLTDVARCTDLEVEQAPSASRPSINHYVKDPSSKDSVVAGPPKEETDLLAESAYLEPGEMLTQVRSRQ